MELLEAFKTALSNEEKGQKLYKETAESTDNPIVRKTFRYLSEQEQYHIDEIKEYIEKLGNGFEVELKGDTLDDTKRFFSMTVKEFKDKLELSDDDVKAHEAALHLEKESYNFYKEQHDNSDDLKVRDFFKFLMEQENAHYELVEKAYSFIKDPESFYTEEEGWILEG